VWTASDKKLASTLKGHEGRVTGLSFSPDGKQLASGGTDKMAIVWTVGKWTQVVRLRHTEPVFGLAFGPDNKSIACAVGGPTEWAVRMRRVDNERSNRAFYQGGGMPQAIVWALKSWRLYAALGDNTIKVTSTSGRVYGTCSGHADWVYALALSPDSKTFASGSADGTVRLWDASRYYLRATLVQFAPGSDEWLVMTAPGYLATSSPKSLTLTLKPTAKGVAVDKLLPVLLSAQNVSKALAGSTVAPPMVTPPPLKKPTVKKPPVKKPVVKTRPVKK